MTKHWIILIGIALTAPLRAAGLFFIENPVVKPFGTALLGSTGLGSWPRQGQTFVTTQDATFLYAEFYLTGGIPGDASRYHATLYTGDFSLQLASATGYTNSPDLGGYKRFTFNPTQVAVGGYAVVLNVDERLPNVWIGYGYDANLYSGGMRVSSTDGGTSWTRSPTLDSAFRFAFVPEPGTTCLLAASVLLLCIRSRRPTV